MTKQPTEIGDRVSDHTVETVTTWRLDAAGLTPALPAMPTRVRHSSVVTTGPISEIVIRRTATSRPRRTQLLVTLIGGDDDQDPDERPFTTFGNGTGSRAAYRVSALPQPYRDLINAQTGLTL